MIDQKRQATSRDCPPPPEHPAPQPNPPGAAKDCKDWEWPKVPALPPSTEPKNCPKPEDCHCPDVPGDSPNCLETLISAQTAEIAAAKKKEAFKADLEKLLVTAKAANLEYTRDKYDSLLKLWIELDKDIAAFLRKLTCAVECWRCVIECNVCPILNELRAAERKLYGQGKHYETVNDLYDLQYWYTREKEDREQRFGKVKLVLAAWEKPGATIEGYIKQNRALLDALDKAPSADAGKVLCDALLKLVPLHLAIAPPASSEVATRIDAQFTALCQCDEPGDCCDNGEPDDCCGPDVGRWSLLQRIVGPTPYLIDPKDYFTIICCLVEKRYGPAQKAVGDADAGLAQTEADIKRYKALLENGLKREVFDKQVKAVVPSPVDCCKYQEPEDDSPAAKAR